MPLFYLDTSAVLKRYFSEKGTDVVDELYHGLVGDELLVTSQLTTLEVEAVAARGLKGRLLERRAYEKLLGAFGQDLFENYLRIVPLEAALVALSAEVIRSNALRADYGGPAGIRVREQ